MVAIGNALGIGQSVTVGYVSAIDREVNIDKNKMTLVQTDAAINLAIVEELSLTWMVK